MVVILHQIFRNWVFKMYLLIQQKLVGIKNNGIISGKKSTDLYSLFQEIIFEFPLKQQNSFIFLLLIRINIVQLINCSLCFSLIGLVFYEHSNESNVLPIVQFYTRNPSPFLTTQLIFTYKLVPTKITHPQLKSGQAIDRRMYYEIYRKKYTSKIPLFSNIQLLFFKSLKFGFIFILSFFLID